MMIKNLKGTLACAGLASGFVLAGQSAQALAGPPYSVDWVNEVVTPQYDIAFAVANDSLGNLFVVGETEGDLNGKVGLYDGYVRKVDPSGNTLWTKQLGKANRYGAFDAVATDSAGNVYVGGHLDAQGQALITKLDTNGGTLWSQPFNNSGAISVDGLAVDSTGGLYFSGTVDGAVFGSTTGGRDVFVGKLDSATGALNWANQSGTAQNDFATGVGFDNSGNLYVSGWTTGDFASPNAGGLDGIYAKFNGATGNFVWSKQFGTAGTDRADQIEIGDDGSVHVVGSSGSSSAVIIKTDQAGTPLLDQTIALGGSNGDFITLASDGSIVEIDFDIATLGYANPNNRGYRPSSCALSFSDLPRDGRLVGPE